MLRQPLVARVAQRKVQGRTRLTAAWVPEKACQYGVVLMWESTPSPCVNRLLPLKQQIVFVLTLSTLRFPFLCYTCLRKMVLYVLDSHLFISGNTFIPISFHWNRLEQIVILSSHKQRTQNSLLTCALQLF